MLMIGDVHTMNGVILYQSKYGATKKYANWISEETGFKCIETKKADIKEVEKKDVIVLGGGIYASGIAGLSFLKKNIDRLKGKKIIVFCCMASPYEENGFKEIVKYNLKDKLSDIPCFYCRGTFDMDSMSFIDRTLCNVLRKSIEKKDPREYVNWEKALVEAGEEKCDWTDKIYVKPIIQAINL